MVKKILAGAVLGVGLFGLGATVVFAQTSNPITLPNPLPSCTGLGCVATNIAVFLQTIALAIAVIMILVGAFQMMTAAGDPEKFSKGRKTILYSVIGTAVVIIAGAAVQIIQSILG